MARQIKNNIIDISTKYNSKDLYYILNRLVGKISQLEEKLLTLSDKNQIITFPSHDGMIILPINDILYMKANSNYTYIHTIDEKCILISKTLKKIETTIIQNPFLRIHHSYLVNPKHIIKIIKHQGTSILLINNLTLPISRSKKDLVLRYFSSSS